MGDKTSIEWTDATWNPIAGCSPVSPGCTHCYAATMARRLEAMGQAKYRGLAERRGEVDVFTGEIAYARPEVITQPLRWTRPRRIFVNSMSDLFHESVTDAAIDLIFAVMALCPQHTFQVLTKRSTRAWEYMTAHHTPYDVYQAARTVVEKIKTQVRPDQLSVDLGRTPALRWPPRNVWLGVSVENQACADERIPELLATPAAVRFLSCEPLLGSIDLDCLREVSGLIDWVIVGGESGTRARPMRAEWAQSLRDQCVAAGVPFFFKQWGESLPFDQSAAAGVRLPLVDAMNHAMTGAPVRCGKKKAGRLLDGHTWDEYPRPTEAAHTV